MSSKAPKHQTLQHPEECVGVSHPNVPNGRGWRQKFGVHPPNFSLSVDDEGIICRRAFLY